MVKNKGKPRHYEEWQPEYTPKTHNLTSKSKRQLDAIRAQALAEDLNLKQIIEGAGFIGLTWAIHEGTISFLETIENMLNFLGDNPLEKAVDFAAAVALAPLMLFGNSYTDQATVLAVISEMAKMSISPLTYKMDATAVISAINKGKQKVSTEAENKFKMAILKIKTLETVIAQKEINIDNALEEIENIQKRRAEIFALDRTPRQPGEIRVITPYDDWSDERIADYLKHLDTEMTRRSDRIFAVRAEQENHRVEIAVWESKKEEAKATLDSGEENKEIAKSVANELNMLAWITSIAIAFIIIKFLESYEFSELIRDATNVASALKPFG